jgi:AmmeMemoRadiSam system protein A
MVEERTKRKTAAWPCHPLVALARDAVETFVRERRLLKPPAERGGELGERAGVFVCLKEHGRLRGCIGTFEPAEETVAEETIRNAVNAAMYDPRFPPIGQGELARLEYSVDVLAPPETVESVRDLDPQRYGVIVRSGSRRGLLLPDLEGVETAEDQVRIARQKAGIAPDEPVELYRFEVRRFT